MRTRVWGKSVVSGVASVKEHFSRPWAWPLGSRKLAAIVTGLTMAIASPGCGQGASSAGEITSEAAAAQFKAGDPEGYTRLNGSEVRNLLVGHAVRHHNTTEPFQYFHPDGRVFTTLENVTTTSRYVIRGDAVCDERPRGWTCRRIYRDRNGRLFELYGGRPNPLMQIETEAGAGAAFSK